MKIILKILCIFSLAFSISVFIHIGNANAGIFGPSNFEECVLANMKGVISDRAAEIIESACSEKFPMKSPDNDTGHQKNKTGQVEVHYQRFLNLVDVAIKEMPGNYAVIEIFNKSELPLSEVRIGVLKKNKFCSYDLNDFESVSACQGKFAAGISTRQTCKITAPVVNEIVPSQRWKYCLTSVMTDVVDTKKFAESLGITPPP